jgi:hypothetical protein
MLNKINSSSNKGENLGKERIKELWEIFIQNANFEFERSLFLKWLNKEKYYNEFQSF